MGRLDSLADVRIFEAVARLHNLSQASRELDLAVNHVSKRLKRLEDQLGVRLVHRTTRKFSLTSEGQALFQQCAAILDSAAIAEEALAGPDEKPRGTLRVTCTNGFGQWQIVPRLTRFLDLYPDIRVHLLATDELVDLVAQGVDVAIRQATSIDSLLVTRRLAPDSRVLVASPAYLERFGHPTALEDLAEHRCLVQDNAARDTWTLSHAGEKRQVKVPITLLSKSGAATHAGALAGVGIALLAGWEVLDDFDAGRLVWVLPDWKGGPNSIQIVYPARDYQPRRVKVFVDFLQSELQATLARLGDRSPF